MSSNAGCSFSIPSLSFFSPQCFTADFQCKHVKKETIIYQAARQILKVHILLSSEKVSNIFMHKGKIVDVGLQTCPSISGREVIEAKKLWNTFYFHKCSYGHLTIVLRQIWTSVKPSFRQRGGRTCTEHLNWCKNNVLFSHEKKKVSMFFCFVCFLAWLFSEFSSNLGFLLAGLDVSMTIVTYITTQEC